MDGGGCPKGIFSLFFSQHRILNSVYDFLCAYRAISGQVCLCRYMAEYYDKFQARLFCSLQRSMQRLFIFFYLHSLHDDELYILHSVIGRHLHLDCRIVMGGCKFNMLEQASSWHQRVARGSRGCPFCFYYMLRLFYDNSDALRFPSEQTVDHF